MERDVCVVDFEKLYMWERFESGYRKNVLSLLEENHQAMLLDLGCRTGEFTIMVANKIGTKNIFGVELVEELTNEAVARGIKVSKGDLNESFPFTDNSFDVICGAQIIEHLCNTDWFLREIHRVLKQGGYVVLSTPNLASFNIIAYLLAGKQPPVACVSDEMEEGWGRKNSKAGPAHRRLFTLPGLIKLLTYHGYKVENAVGSSYYLLPIPLARFMCPLDKKHSACINIKARKESTT